MVQWDFAASSYRFMFWKLKYAHNDAIFDIQDEISAFTEMFSKIFPA